MSDQDFPIDNLQQEMESFLKSQARKLPSPSQPLYFRNEYKHTLKLGDSNKNSYPVEESYLSTFRDIYVKPQYKTVRLHNWEFQLIFEGKKCKSIALISDYVVFLANKANKKQLNDCYFKVIVVEGDGFKKLTKEVLGYINRLGKRNLVSLSSNVGKQMRSLLSFTDKQTSKKIDPFNFKPWSKQRSDIDPLTCINAEGRKVLEKLRHFISRADIQKFLVEQEISEHGHAELQKFLTVAGEEKKKSKQERQILQKSSHE